MKGYDKITPFPANKNQGRKVCASNVIYNAQLCAENEENVKFAYKSRRGCARDNAVAVVAVVAVSPVEGVAPLGWWLRRMH